MTFDQRNRMLLSNKAMICDKHQRLILIAIISVFFFASGFSKDSSDLNEIEQRILMTLSLQSLQNTPESSSNSYANREDSAAFGHLLFFDPALSSTGSISCSSCHDRNLFFSDGLKQSKGIGVLKRNAPTLIGSAYSSWLFWDGRRDSLWAQALSPIEAKNEMGLSRVELLKVINDDDTYRELYNRIFGKLPSLEGIPEKASPIGDLQNQRAWETISPIRQRQISVAFANIGKSLEAYQRKLLPGEGRFDLAIRLINEGQSNRGRRLLKSDEWEGAKLFVNPGKTLCLRCHNGPLLTNQSFHRIGINRKTPPYDGGRFSGIDLVLQDPFNCFGQFSDAKPEECTELLFLKRRQVETQYTAFKTPTLRGLSKTAPYMHDGSIASVGEVLEHYRNPPIASPVKHELIPLVLTDKEILQLETFLFSLGSNISTEEKWLQPPKRERLKAAPNEPQNF